MSQEQQSDKSHRSPLARAKLMLDAKVVIEHYNRIIETIDEHRLVLDRQEADFVMTVEDYQTLRDFACRNDAPPQAINLEGIDGDEMDKSSDRAALLTRLMAAGEPRETIPSHVGQNVGPTAIITPATNIAGMTTNAARPRPDSIASEPEVISGGTSGAVAAVPSTTPQKEPSKLPWGMPVTFDAGRLWLISANGEWLCQVRGAREQWGQWLADAINAYAASATRFSEVENYIRRLMHSCPTNTEVVRIACDLNALLRPTDGTAK